MQSNGNENQGYDPLHDGPELGHPNSNPIEQQNEAIHTDKVKDFLGFREPLQRVAAGAVTLILLVVVAFGLKNVYQGINRLQLLSHPTEIFLLPLQAR